MQDVVIKKESNVHLLSHLDYGRVEKMHVAGRSNSVNCIEYTIEGQRYITWAQLASMKCIWGKFYQRGGHLIKTK